MKKLYSRLMAGILLACISLSVYADSVTIETIHDAATQRPDMSRKLLVMVFGSVVENPLNPSAPSLIGQLYGVFNAIIAGLAFFWFVGITLRTTVRTGHRGKLFSNGHTLMAPVTSLAGFMALVPTPSGWSISNLIFLWTASIMGVGSANLLTDTAILSVMNGQSLVVQPIAAQTVSAAHGIYQIYLCQNALNKEQDTMHQNGGASDTPSMTETSLDGGKGFKIGNGSAFCGSAHLPSVQKVEADKFTFGVPIDTSTIEEAQKKAFTTIRETLSQKADAFTTAFLARQDSGSGTLPDAETDIQAAARAYEDTINQSVQSLNNQGTLQSKVFEQLHTNGWIALGAWYQTFATANTKTSEIAKMSPNVTGPSGLGEVGTRSLYTQLDTAYQSRLQNTTYIAPLGTISSDSAKAVADAQTPDDAIVSLMPWEEEFTNWLTNIDFGSSQNDYSNQVNPMLKMKALGDFTLDGAEVTFTLYTAARTAIAFIKGNNAAGLTARIFNAFTGASDIAVGILDAISPTVYFLIFLLLSVGFSLSIFLPFIPFIYWMTACASWLASVLIGTTAGSLWAWTHIGGEEDKGSRSAYGYIFLVDAAIRPSLMVFGFFFSSLVIAAIGTLLNQLFAPALANVQANSVTGVVSCVGILMIYARLCTTLASSAFSLQVYMPDYVIAWLGGREAAQLMNGAVDSARNMFVAFGSGAGRAPNAKQIVKNKEPDGDANGFKL